MTQKKFMELLTRELRKYFSEEEYEIEGDVFLKINDTKRLGLVIRKIGETIAPTVYIDHFYDDYIKKKCTLEEIASQLWQVVCGFDAREDAYQSFSVELEDCREKIIFRLISQEKNSAYLTHLPHLPFLNLAIIFVVVHQLSDQGLESICITNELQKKWNISTKDLYTLAAENTPRLLPPSMNTMAQTIESFFGEETKEYLESEKPIPHIYIISNKYGINGASTLLYEGFIQHIAEEKEQNFYILPSSIHEILLIPDTVQGILPRLSEMVRDINENHVRTDEILSDQAYYYDRTEKRFLM